MDHFVEIYRHRAADYHRMVQPEDADGNLLPALERVAPLDGRRILDLGSGTGRLPLLLAGRAAQVVALDLHTGMLREHLRQRELRGGSWPLLRGDMRALPVSAGWADVVTAGWAIGHFVGWYGAEWPAQIDRVLKEMHRVVRPGGALIIVETLTTGSLVPAPPNKGLARYYHRLETTWGFSRQQIRTDYQFDNVDDAVARTEFFFGAELSAKVRANGWARLPEWSGVWGKSLQP
ncbi:MAG: class I SAM-dependent methyltransferase [Chloroflexi bacterium]|nr:MAG: class I SAM-dependent methyltransferase [Chloroflexota bacterium]